MLVSSFFERMEESKVKQDHIELRTGRNELQIESIVALRERRQLNWWRHMSRMKEKRQARQVWEVKVQKIRNRGRPKETWNRTVYRKNE